MKNIIIFSLKIFIFLVVNFSVYLNRHVFVMLIHSFVSSTGTLDRKGLTMKAPTTHTTDYILNSFLFF